MTIQEYVDQVNRRFKTGISREHSYRGDLQTLLGDLLPELLITNEPSRSEVGAPDYILTKGAIPVGYIEAKDIDDADLLGKKHHKEQFNRYKSGLPNLIFTDYLDFHFYKEGEFVTSIRIAETQNGSIVGKPENYASFTNLIKDFGQFIGQTIKSSNKLSKLMAGKARLLADIIQKSVDADLENANKEGYSSANRTLREQLSAFKNILIHDINSKDFADVYAQTIAYGMFAARLHDPTLESFSRQEAAELIPKTNPFLRRLFGYIAGPDIDERIVWIVDSLADIFRATDVDGLLKNFGKATQQHDPIIHFYETFLAEYDPKLRKSRGVWYTPEPVVNFIVRAVDDILKDEFGLKDGLADTSKTTIKVNTDVKDGRSATGYKQEEREVHKVQILDPATGTGTFLAEVIKQIYTRFEGQQGIWAKYVEEHLIPRLNGFEILMASYAMAHLKLDLLLRETGVTPSGTQRFKVYLTNSLEEHHKDTGTLFASWLSEEANEANHIKRDTPVMVVLGNPPYSGISSNMGKWISDLIEDYKYVDGEHFGERKHWLHDDYVKFIRYGQYLIDKNGEGVLAFINNHSFIDNPTFRGMRWNLMKSFNKIYIYDLHGSSKRDKNYSGDEVDKNVFDIQQGVSINIFLKKKDDKVLGKVYKFDLHGSREKKYSSLSNQSFREVPFNEISNQEPYFFFLQKNYSLGESFKKGFKVDELFSESVTGVLTARDHLVIDFSNEELLSRIRTFCNQSYSDNQIRELFFGDRKAGKYLKGDTRGWKLTEARESLKEVEHLKKIKDYSYRPFDNRKIYYSSEMVDWGRESYMKHVDGKNNFALDICRQLISDQYNHIFVTNRIVDDSFVSNKSRERGYLLPLYLYPEESGQQTLDGQPERTPNLDKKLVKEIEQKLGLKFMPEKEGAESPQTPDQVRGDNIKVNDDKKNKSRHAEPSPELDSGSTASVEGVDSVNEPSTFAPIDLLDYIYAVLHSPAYREKYKEFLKIDFPRVPYPEDPAKFWQLVELGGELRQIHLLEHPVVEQFITTYPVGGDNVVRNKLTKTQPGFVEDEVPESPQTPDQVRGNNNKNNDDKKNKSRHAEPSPELDSGSTASVEGNTSDEQSLGKVWINEEQYFGNVPLTAWEFYIGGYQPAQKWLKDRRDRELSFYDIRHYQKIIVALTETDRLMKEIDEVGVVED